MEPVVQFFLDPEAKKGGCSFAAPREGDAGFDLYSAETVELAPGEQALIETGLYLAIPIGWVGIVKDRSSMALAMLRTHAGVIDSSYRGEVKVVLSNAGHDATTIQRGQKFAQLLVVPYAAHMSEVQSVTELGVSVRGAGGFGSTGG